MTLTQKFLAAGAVVLGSLTLLAPAAHAAQNPDGCPWGLQTVGDTHPLAHVGETWTGYFTNIVGSTFTAPSFVETDYYAYCVDVENSDAPEVVYFDGATDGPFVIRHSTGGEIETLSFVKQSPPPTTTSTTSTTVPETTTTTVPETTTTTVPETTTTTVPGTTSTVPTTDTTPTTQPGITTTTIRTEHPRTGSDHAVPMTAIGLGLILVGTTILVSRAKRRVASV